ncbi:hypothetical protein OAU50_03065 [Planctomycetota bacterium]|nr:hypothetical protein [Planctomycetota bacterium]
MLEPSCDKGNGKFIYGPLLVLLGHIVWLVLGYILHSDEVGYWYFGVFSIGLCQFLYVIPIGFVLFFRKQSRALAGATSTAAITFLLSIAACASGLGGPIS